MSSTVSGSHESPVNSNYFKNIISVALYSMLYTPQLAYLFLIDYSFIITIHLIQ